MEEKPIYKFEGLKSLLRSMGYQIEKAIGYKPVENKDVDLNELKNNIEFSSNGIFLMDDSTGSKQQIFLYKRNYHLEKYGKPRFHIRKCQTIQSFIDSGAFEYEYRRANTESVKVCDLDDFNKDKNVCKLPLCQYCFKMVKGISNGMTTTDFVNILKENKDIEEDNQKDKEVDILGYTKDWEQISRFYREKKSYRCERCQLQVTSPIDQYYMHVHHKDGNKLNNRESNLECLCIHCHSMVDDIHYMRFHTGANAVILKAFEEQYLNNNKM